MSEIEIIAEIGVNHDGEVAKAHGLIDNAKYAGCDVAKFQLWNTERVYPRERWEKMKKLELSVEQLAGLKDHCEHFGIEFMCTPDDEQDLEALVRLGVKRIKIGSSNVRNLPLLAKVAKLGKPVILSTGACSWEELNSAVSVISAYMAGPRALTVLHCVSAYPAPLDEANLSVIRSLESIYNADVGFSDHTVGHTAALIALGLGATVFEKHITWNRCAPGPDHYASVEYLEMVHYVRDLRVGAAALGDGIKSVMPCEVENRREYERFVRHQTETVRC